MRTTLKTTTAVLACLNLAVPYPAIAQTAVAPGAPDTDASSVCAIDPDSQECRDEVARDLAQEEAQAEAAAGEGQAQEGGDGDQADAGQASAPPVAPETAAGSGVEEGQEPSLMEVGEGEEQTPAAPEPAGEVPDAGAPEGDTVVEEPVPDAVPPADGAGGGAGVPSSADASEAGAGNDPDASAGEPLGGDLPETGAENEAEAVTGDGNDDTAATPAIGGEDQTQAQEAEAGEGQALVGDAEAGEGETQPREAATGDESSEPNPAGEDAPSATTPEPTPAPEEDTGTRDPSADSAVAPTASDAPEAAPAGRTATPDAEPSDETDAEAAAGSATDIQADSPAAENAEAGGALAEGDGDQPAQQRDDATAGEGAEARQGAEGEQPRAAIAAVAADEGEAEEVTTETVTEESARSSDEDFATQIDQSPEATSDEGDDDGLSNLEKALLVGAGALAVGSLLRNGREVVATSGDRVVVSGSDGNYELIKDDSALLRRPGSEVETQTYEDGSTRTIVNRTDGSQIITIRDPELRVVRRVRVTPEGEEIVLIDDTEEVQPVDMSALQAPAAETRIYSQSMDQEALRQALAANQAFERSYSLNQVRSIEQVREQVPAIDLETITFASGSAAIRPEQADQLTQLGQYIANRIDENPREIFLVEGHTDAVGDAAYNLALSDRRAESVALALTEYFDVPPENLVVQGYGEQFLKVETEAAEQANRRASIRRITPLLQAAAAR